MPKKFLWLNGSTHETQDPNWNQHEAQRRGLIPVSKNPAPVRVANTNLIQEVHINSLGSFAWDRSGLVDN